MKGIQVSSNEGPHPSQRGDNRELIKVNWQLLKIFFSRTTGPILTKLDTKYPWVKGIQVCSKEGPRPFPRGDNYEIVKIQWRNLKTWSSPEPLGQFQPKLAQSILGWRGFKFLQMKGPALFQGKIITKLWKYIDEIKRFSPEPLSHFQPNLAQNILGWRGFKFVQMKDPALFQGEIIVK